MALKSNRSLKLLDLTGSSMDCEAITQLCSGLTHNRSVETLILDFNAFGEDGAIALSKMLRENTDIAELHLFGNNISPSGATVLADALAVNEGLSSLILSFNQIGDTGISAVADALIENKTLRKLWLPSNGIGCYGIKALARELPKMHGLETLHVGLLLDESSVDDLAAALKHNQYLVDLHFEQPCFLEEEETPASCTIIELFLRMNRKGRQYIRSKKIPPTLWPYILAQKADRSSVSEAPDILYYLLRENPDLCDQGRIGTCIINP
ncbi:hypothetical protein ACA910_008613 [Epithemia clementina (nom. ined.)]